MTMKLLYDHSTHSLITPTGATFATIDPNVTAKEGQHVADELEMAKELEGKLYDVEADFKRSRDDASDLENEASAAISSIIREIDDVFLSVDASEAVFEEIEEAIDNILKPHR